MRMLDVGGTPPVFPPIKETVMITTAKDQNATARKAPSDGAYWFNGLKHKTRAGAVLPEGAQFEAADGAKSDVVTFHPWTDDQSGGEPGQPIEAFATNVGYLAEDITDPETGEVIVAAGTE